MKPGIYNIYYTYTPDFIHPSNHHAFFPTPKNSIHRLQAHLQLARHRRQRRLRQLHPQQAPRGRRGRLAAVAPTAAQPEGSGGLARGCNVVVMWVLHKPNSRREGNGKVIYMLYKCIYTQYR